MGGDGGVQVPGGCLDREAVCGLSGLPGGVVQDQVGLFAECGPSGGVVGQDGGAVVEQSEQGVDAVRPSRISTESVLVSPGCSRRVSRCNCWDSRCRNAGVCVG